MTITSTGVEAVLPADLDQRELAGLDEALHRDAHVRGARLTTGSGETYEIPDELSAVIVQLIHELAAGNSVTVTPTRRALTSQEAARLLGVSRPHLIKLLEAGELPYHYVGTHRRVEAADLAAYQDRRRVQRRVARQHLTELSVDAGLET